MNKNTSAKLGHWLDRLFGNYSDKIKIIANVLVHDWRMTLPLYFDHSFTRVSDDEANTFSADFDVESQKTISTYIDLQRIVSSQKRYPGFCFYNYEKLFSRQELHLRSRLMKEFLKLRKKYAFPGVGPESLLFHHGLPFFPETAIEYLVGGNYIDAGACYGDSTMIFSRFYKPDRIYAFEPSLKNREVMKAMMSRFHITTECYEMEPLGLGVKRESLVFCERGGNSGFGNRGSGEEFAVNILPLDDFAEEHHLTKVRLIKADLEGMGLAMLQGSQQTIRENRPILTLSIYHNREELFEIYQTLRSWNLNYEFTIRSTAYPVAFSEINLLGYPMELNPGPDMWNTNEAAFKKIFEVSKLLLQN